MTGRLLVGTSGFSYPDWTPRFYPAGTSAAERLAVYASRLPALELNATFRRRPTASAIQGWVRATPPDFRFAVKAQRGSAVRALFGAPEESIAWLTEPLGEFGERLGAVLFRVPAEIRRDGPWVDGDSALADARLAAFLAAWPREIPLVVELQDPTWHVDETFAALRTAGATLCTTELPPEGDEGAVGAGAANVQGAAGAGVAGTHGAARAGRAGVAGTHGAARAGVQGAAGAGASGQSATGAEREPPIVRRTGSFLYLRLRLHDYDAAGLDAWAARVEPFLAAGDDVYVFFRHDPVGRAAELALGLRSRLADR